MYSKKSTPTAGTKRHPSTVTMPIYPEDEGGSGSTEVIKSTLTRQEFNPNTGQMEEVPLELVVYWDKLEILLADAGHPASDLGKGYTHTEKLRLTRLADQYDIGESKYMHFRRATR